MRVLAAVALALLCAGCASVMRGHSNQVAIQSNPHGALARTSLGHQCLTPCVLQIPRRDEFIVTIEKPGFHIAEVHVTTHLANEGVAGFAGNVIIGGAVGMVVDAASGATLDHYPNPIIAELVPVRPGEAVRTIVRAPPERIRVENQQIETLEPLRQPVQPEPEPPRWR